MPLSKEQRQQYRFAVADELATLRVINNTLRLNLAEPRDRADLEAARRTSVLLVRDYLDKLRPNGRCK